MAQFRAYCDICHKASDWTPTPISAKMWRHNHFAVRHEDNPMKKQNCRIQRYPINER